jgi:hypothetical protein
VDEDSLIKNGSFNAGLSGYEVYAYTTSDVSYTVDSLSEDNAFDITIKDTGDAEWKIQLKQDNVTLEKGQWYTLKFDVKSSVERKLQYAIQRDGSDHQTAAGAEDWTPYVQDIVTVGSDYTTITKTFQMTEDTDAESIFNIALGTLSGETRITAQHRICIDNISLEKVDAPAADVTPGTNLLKNADFSDETNSMANWTETIANWGDAYVTDASHEITNGTIVYSIANPGTEDWHVQLKQSGVSLTAGKTYTVSYTITSTVARQINSGVMSTDYKWYGGKEPVLEANKETTVTYEFTMENDDAAADFYISLGKIGDGQYGEHTITISDVSLVEN